MTDKEQDNALRVETLLACEEFSTTSLPLREGLHFELQNLASGDEPDSLEPASICSASGSPLEYDLVERIGSGGMGTVYRARHKVLNKTVAVKMLHKELAGDPVNLRRFQIEATAAGSLTHANLAAVYDSGVTEDGTPYLVMDYLHGVSLDAILKMEGFLEYDRFFNIFGQVCEALTHAHSKSIVHRDLKPSNIVIVRREGGQEHVKLVDFGIARVLQRSLADGSRLTQTGEVVGSPDYMSPEQCLGLDPDERSDIYSLGVVMYEALAGRTPFRGNNNIQIIVAHINKEPRLISRLRPDLRIPIELEELIMKSLQKEPEKRFQSVKQLSYALSQIREGRKSSFKSVFERAGRRIRNSLQCDERTIHVGKVLATSLFATVTIAIVTNRIGLIENQFAPYKIIPEEGSQPIFEDFLDRAQNSVREGKPAAVAMNYTRAIEFARKRKVPGEKIYYMGCMAGRDLVGMAEFIDREKFTEIILQAEQFFVQAMDVPISTFSYDFDKGEYQFEKMELMSSLAEIRHFKKDYVSEEQLLRSVIEESQSCKVVPAENFMGGVYMRLAGLLKDQHRYDEAESALKSAIKYEGVDYSARYARWQLAKVYLKHGKIKSAIQLFHQAVNSVLGANDLDTHDRAYYLLEWKALMHSMGRPADAAEVKRQIMKYKIPMRSDDASEDEDPEQERWGHFIMGHGE